MVKYSDQVVITATHPYSEPKSRDVILLRQVAPGMAVAWDAEDCALCLVDIVSKNNDIIESLFECKRRFPFISNKLSNHNAKQ